jgi:hypothetical protein
MSRRRGIMSESFKNELAKDLGFYDVVQREGWEGIRTKDAGNMVKRAIQIAQEQLVKQYTASTPAINQSQSAYSQSSYNHPGYNPPNYNKSSYQAIQTPQSYSQTAFSQSGGMGQSQPSYTPNPNNTYTNAFSQPSPNQTNAAMLNQIMAGSQQAAQAEQRPYQS